MASAFCPSGLGSRWLKRVNSTSGRALRRGEGDCASAEAVTNNKVERILAGTGTTRNRASRVRGVLVVDAHTRERRRPLFRVYFTGRRFGSIFVRPVPLFTSMI